MPIRLLAFILSPLLFISAPSNSATLHVPAEYPTIQQAVDAANAGDEVVVAPGTYNQTTTRTIPDVGDITSVVFLKAGITLVSESGPEATFIDKVPGNQNTVHAVVAFNLDGPTTTVQGFTIRAMAGGFTTMRIHYGSSSTWVDLRNLVFDGLGRDIRGLSTFNINISTENCTFRNFTQYSLGTFTFDLWIGASRSLMVQGCLFEESIGSGLRVDAPSGTSLVQMMVKNCTFRSLPLTWQGALYLYGRFNASSVENCVFEDIVARINYGGSAGAIYAAHSHPSSPLRILNNVFIHTSTDAAGGVGAISCATFTQPYEIVGNTVVGCSAPNGSASAIRVLSSSSQNLLHNNVIADCVGPPEAVVVDGAVQSDCNIFWNNAGGDASGFSLGPRDRVADPLFCDLKMRDFTVREGSPCLPENSLGCGLIGVFGQGCGAVSVVPTSWGQIKEMYR